MAIFHLHVKNISRGAGPRIRSAVAAAAYRAGETLPNDAEERASKFGGRRDVVHAEIRLPEGAPAWMGNRGELWNAVEAAEKRRDARLAKEIEFSLPRELDQAAWIALARKMADAYTSQGHVADVAIHEDGRGHNPHAHIMLTTRTIGPEGFGLKMREADGKAFVRSARALWEKIANEALGTAGSAVMIDARSHAARGLSYDPKNVVSIGSKPPWHESTPSVPKSSRLMGKPCRRSRRRTTTGKPDLIARAICSTACAIG